jgi:hypothetical protein
VDQQRISQTERIKDNCRQIADAVEACDRDASKVARYVSGQHDLHQRLLALRYPALNARFAINELFKATKPTLEATAKTLEAAQSAAALAATKLAETRALWAEYEEKPVVAKPTPAADSPEPKDEIERRVVAKDEVIDSPKPKVPEVVEPNSPKVVGFSSLLNARYAQSDPDAFRRNLADLSWLSRKLGRVPDPDEALTRPKSVVCEPFLGSGTTACAVARLGQGRQFWGSEVDSETSGLARHRVAQELKTDSVVTMTAIR